MVQDREEMADAEEDNIFEDEQKIIEYAERELSDDDDDDEEEADEAKKESSSSSSLKKEKKKRKFSEMKEKKLLARSSSSSSSSEGEEEESPLQVFLKHKPPSAPSDFSPEHFLQLNPHPSSSSITAKKKKKPPSPPSLFLDAIDQAVPSREDLLRAGDTEECSPRVVVVCSGARRGCDVIQILSKHYKCKVGKLFAKHFRIQDQIEVLNATDFPIVVGTPHRLHKLVEMGSLSLSQTLLVVVDMCKDVKGFHVMSLCDTKNDFYTFMGTSCSKEKDHLRIALVSDDSAVELKKRKPKQFEFNKNNKKFRSQHNNKNRQGVQKK